MTGIDDIAPEQFGTATRVGDAFEIVFARDYPQPHDALWAAVTEPAQTELWWAESRIDPRVGGEFAVRWLNGRDGVPLEWLEGEVLSIEPGRAIASSNSDHGLLCWEIERTPVGSRLKFTNRVTPPDGRSAAMSLAGWHIHLDHLAAALDGQRIDWPNWHTQYGPAWEALHEHYRTRDELA